MTVPRAAEGGGPAERVRPARPGDEARLVELWTSLATHHVALDPVFCLHPDFATDAHALLARALGAEEESAALVWEDDAGLAGLCIVRIDRSPALLAERLRAEVTELVVDPGRRREGIASALVGEALRWASGRGARRVEARVAVANTAGQAFWRRLGFADFVDVLDRRL